MIATVSNCRSFRVGEYYMHPDKHLLVHIRIGSSQQIRHMSVLLLVYLAQHPNAVCSKDGIAEVLWDATVIIGVNNRIESLISDLRKAFSDNPRNPEYIQTIPKGGYCLIAPITWDIGRSPPMQPPLPPSSDSFLL